MKSAIELGRVGREHREIALKQPLKEITIIHCDAQVLEYIKAVEGYFLSELNVRHAHYSTDEFQYVSLKADADGRVRVHNSEEEHMTPKVNESLK